VDKKSHSGQWEIEPLSEEAVKAGPFLIQIDQVSRDTIQALRFVMPSETYKLIKNRLVSRMNRLNSSNKKN
jgi:hypothetical protein